MSSEWRLGKLGDFIELKRGYDLPQAQRVSGPYPLVSSSGVSDCHSKPMVRGPGVITGRYGTIGQVYFVEDDFWPLNTTLYVRDFKGNDPKFISYYLKTVDFFAYSDKAAVPGVNRNHLHEALGAIPDLSTQQEIARTLGSLDDRISLLRETNTTLEAIAQALFKSWFVDFDPVRAKQQGIAPQGMDAATAALFPDSFEVSELGEVPMGWRILPLNQLCKISSGKRPNVRSDAETSDAAIPLFGGAGKMGFTNESLFEIPQIVTGRVGTLGKVHIAYPPFWASDNVLVVSPLESQSFHFCFLWLTSIDVHALNRGSTQPLLTQKDLGNQLHVTPNNSVLEEFSVVVNPIYEKMHANIEQIQTLATLRDTLLPRLISGQLQLPA